MPQDEQLNSIRIPFFAFLNYKISKDIIFKILLNKTNNSNF